MRIPTAKLIIFDEYMVIFILKNQKTAKIICFLIIFDYICNVESSITPFSRNISI